MTERERAPVVLQLLPHPGIATLQELHILALKLCGYSREEIARQLGIRPDTVRAHLSNLGYNAKGALFKKSIEEWERIVDKEATPWFILSLLKELGCVRSERASSSESNLERIFCEMEKKGRGATPTEKEVIKAYILELKTRKEVAELQGNSVNTVRIHLSKFYKRFAQVFPGFPPGEPYKRSSWLRFFVHFGCWPSEVEVVREDGRIKIVKVKKT